MNGLRKHYHWVIALVVLIKLAIYSGILNNIISLHLIPVTEDLGISRGSFSLAFSIRSLVGFFSTLFSGVFFVKYGYRKLASIFLFVAAGAFVLLGSSQNFLMLSLASAILGLGEGFCIGHSYFCDLKAITDEVLRDIVEYEIAPLLREYWYDEKSKAENAIANLKDAVR